MSFFTLQTSSMSREALLALPLLAFAGVAVILGQNWVTLPSQIRLAAGPFEITSAVLALAFLFSQARILTASHGVPAWREPSLQIVIIVSGIAEGLGLLLALGVFIAESAGLDRRSCHCGLGGTRRGMGGLPASCETDSTRAGSRCSQSSLSQYSFGPLRRGHLPDRVTCDAFTGCVGGHRRPRAVYNGSLVEVRRCDPCGFHPGIFYSLPASAGTYRHRVTWPRLSPFGIAMNQVDEPA